LQRGKRTHAHAAAAVLRDGERPRVLREAGGGAPEVRHAGGGDPRHGRVVRGARPVGIVRTAADLCRLHVVALVRAGGARDLRVSPPRAGRPAAVPDARLPADADPLCRRGARDRRQHDRRAAGAVDCRPRLRASRCARVLRVAKARYESRRVVRVKTHAIERRADGDGHLFATRHPVGVERGRQSTNTPLSPRLALLPCLAAIALASLSAAQGTRAPGAALRWYKGNTHTHTLNSDGDSTPDDVVKWYREHGYNFLVLSDHNFLTSVDGLNAVHGADDTFLVIRGEEVTDRSG